MRLVSGMAFLGGAARTGRGAAGARRSACRERAAGHRELRGQDLRHHALSGSVQALDQAGAHGGERLRRGHRGQAHIDQRSRGALRHAGAGAGQRHGRQAAGDRGGRRARHRSGGPAARRRRLFRHASGAAARERAAADQGCGARLRLSDRRHLALDHQGHRVAHRVRLLQLPGVGAAHPESTPRSIPATAAARRSPATR